MAIDTVIMIGVRMRIQNVLRSFPQIFDGEHAARVRLQSDPPE